MQLIKTMRVAAMAAAAVGVGVVGVTMVFAAWLATNITAKHG